MSGGTKLDDGLTAQIDEKGLLAELVEFKRQELTRLQQAVLSEQATLVQVKQDIESAKRQAKYEQGIEEQKFKDKLQGQFDALQSRRKELERLDLELEGRRKDVEELEARAKPIAKAQEALRNERIAIEQQRVRNEELRLQNDRLANQVSAQHEEVAQLKASLLAEQTRVSTQASEQDQQQARLDQREKDMALQAENLTALKAIIDPKLAEVKRAEEQAAKDVTQAKEIQAETLNGQAELEKQRADLSILSNQLEAKGSALIEYEGRLKQLEAELRIKSQQAEVQGGKGKEAKGS